MNRAVGWMLAATSGYSLPPLVISLAGGAGSPFLYGAIFRAGAAAACMAFLMARHPRILRNRLIAKHALRWPENRFLVLAVIGAEEYPLLAAPVNFMDIAVAAILFETWPVIAIFITARLFRTAGRYRSITPKTMFLVMLSAAASSSPAPTRGPGRDLPLAPHWRSPPRRAQRWPPAD